MASKSNKKTATKKSSKKEKPEIEVLELVEKSAIFGETIEPLETVERAEIQAAGETVKIDVSVDLPIEEVAAIEAEEAESAEYNEDEMLELASKEGLLVNERIEGADVEAATVDEMEKLGLTTEQQNWLMSGMETILFMSDKAVSLGKLRSTIDSEIPLKAYRFLMEKLRNEFAAENRGVEIAEVSGGFQLRTKPQMAAILRNMVKTQPIKLTPTNMETLAVIAYKQPLTKDEVDRIRGVDSGYMLRNLMEKRLVKIEGRADHLPGKPILYGTSHEFLELFTLKDLTQLPPLHEIESMVAESEIGDVEEEEKEMKLFGEMVETQSTNLFEESGIDEQIEELRTEIAAISTSTEYIDLQKQREKLQGSLMAPNLADEKRADLEANLAEVDRKIAILTTGETMDAEIEQELVAAEANAETASQEVLDNAEALSHEIADAIAASNIESSESPTLDETPAEDTAPLMTADEIVAIESELVEDKFEPETNV